MGKGGDGGEGGGVISHFGAAATIWDLHVLPEESSLCNVMDFVVTSSHPTQPSSFPHHVAAAAATSAA